MASRTPTVITLACGTNLWTNQPAALTEFLGTTASRVRINLVDFDRFRVAARVVTPGFAGSVLGVQYSPDEVTWTTLATVSLTAAGTLANGWTDLPAGAKADVYLRLGGQGGNATADPVIGLVTLQLYSVPTLERGGLAEQIVTNLYGLIRNMRDNATDYKARVAAGRPVAGIVAVMVSDANAYLVRIAWITSLFDRNPALASSALGDRGFTTAQATALRDTLATAANHTITASPALLTGALINVEADWVLANIPNYERLW